MPKTNGPSLSVVAWSGDDLELLHWPTGDGGVLCGFEDFVWVTLDREVFDAHERACLTCSPCAELLHASSKDCLSRGFEQGD